MKKKKKLSIQTAQTIQNQIISILKKNVAKSPSIPRREHPNEKSVAKTYSPATGATSGNNDIFSMTQPQIIKNIYMEYLEVGGSDMIGDGRCFVEIFCGKTSAY